MKLNNEKIIQDFANLLETSYKEYKIYSQQVSDMDKATQDVLHQLELGEKISISKWSKELVNVRKRRRYAKDMSVKLEPLYQYYVNNQKEINKLKMIVGELRKIDKHQKNRIYKPRVIQIEIQGEHND